MSKEKLERLLKLLREAKSLSVELLLDRATADISKEQAQLVEQAYYRLADAHFLVGESVKLGP